MPRYRIHRIKDAPRENFRWAAHSRGVAVIKPKDYDVAGEIEASTAYAAWHALYTKGRPLGIGDVLEIIEPDGSRGALQIAKYIGFEPAGWYVPAAPAPATVTAEIPTPSDTNSLPILPE